MKNPLLEKFDQPFGTIPFKDIKTEHFLPALDAAIDEAKEEISAITDNQETPTFENTVLAQELCGKNLYLCFPRYGKVTNFLGTESFGRYHQGECFRRYIKSLIRGCI